MSGITTGPTLHEMFKNTPDLKKDGSNVLQLPPPLGNHKVTVVEDTRKAYPMLYLAVHVLGDRWEEAQFANLMARSGCYRAESLERADLVVFTGGVDVDPRLYGEEPHESTRWNEKRDTDDITAYMKCLDMGIPMFGVCRGAQLLSVLNGGKLYQDVNNHQGAHSMWDQKNSVFIRNISSVHHQMCRDNTEGGMEIIAYSRGTSSKRWLNKSQSEEGRDVDIEAFFYRDTCCFGVQGHPEYRNYTQYSIWCLQMIEDLITSSVDTEWRDKTLRLKEEVLQTRKKPVPSPENVTVPKTRKRKAA